MGTKLRAKGAMDEMRGMRGLRLLWTVVKRSGAITPLTGFLGMYLLCALIVWVVEPSVHTYVDALWFLWAVSTTVGLGDVTADTFIGRAAAIVCSIYAIVTTAIITAVVVDFFHERREAQINDAKSEFLDKLERLPELSREELQAMSERIKELRY